MAVTKLDARSVGVARATVYADRAEVTRVCRTRLKGKQAEVRLAGISPHVDADSVRVECAAGAVLVDVCHRCAYEVDDDPHNGAAAEDAAVAEKRAALDAVRAELEDLRCEDTHVAREAELIHQYARARVGLNSNSNSNDDDTKVKPDDPTSFFERLLPLYSAAAHDRARRTLDLARRIRSAQKRERDLEQWLHTRQQQRQQDRQGRDVHSIHVTLELPGNDEGTERDVELTVKYVVACASWSPLYDVRVVAAEQRVQLTYAATVQQSTGEDWADTQLTLSTARIATVAGEPPAFKHPWTINKRPPPPKPPSSATPRLMMSKRVGAARGQSFGSAEDAMAGLPSPPPVMCMAPAPMPGGGGMPEAEIATLEAFTMGSAAPPPPSAEVASSASATATHYRIPVPYTIPSDGQDHRVTITAALTLPATLSLRACPKLSTDAYLTAAVHNESEYALLPGACAVFLDGAFVAKSRLPLVLPRAEFAANLGPDAGVEITYAPVEKYTSAKAEGGALAAMFKGADAADTLVVAYTHRIRVQARRAATLVVHDQVPKSAHADIRVHLVEPAEKEVTIRESSPSGATALEPAESSSSSSSPASPPSKPTWYRDLGVVEWRLELKEREEREIVWRYSVQYPKGAEVIGLE